MFSCFYEVRGITLWPFIFLAEGPADESWFRRMGGYAGLVASNKRCVAA